VVTVENRPELGRYQLLVDRQVAGYVAYEVHGAHLAFMHTEIEDRFAGQGLGARLVEAALDDVRAQGRSVLPYCPFVRSFIARRQEYADLVPASRREAFGLDRAPADRGASS
jgi:uncharacterized protein